MPAEGLEPPHPSGQQILSLSRLPFRHAGNLTAQGCSTGEVVDVKARLWAIWGKGGLEVLVEPASEVADVPWHGEPAVFGSRVPDDFDGASGGTGTGGEPFGLLGGGQGVGKAMVNQGGGQRGMVVQGR